MKRCPSCNRTIDDDSQSFCPSDGARLVNDAAPPAADDFLQATIMATPSMRPSSELPPPDAFQTNSGQLNQPPAPNPGWPQNPYQTNAQWSNQQTPPPPPPQNPPAWQTPSAPLPQAAAPKRGMNTKLLIGGGLGCLGLLLIGVVGIIIAVAVFGGPSSKMNPYTGSLRDLAPSYVGSYKRSDIDTLGERDMDGFGRVKEAIGVAYKGSGDNSVQVFIGNYASADDAKDGLRTFKNRLSDRGWTAGAIIDKKLGWSKVGSTFSAYRSSSSNRAPEPALSDGAVMVYTQSASPSPSKSKYQEINCWTNGSVLYAVGGVGADSYLFETEFDKAAK